MKRATFPSSSNAVRQAVGVFFYCATTDRFLYLLRSDEKNCFWGMPGGKVEADETLIVAITRECKEEMDFDLSIDELKLVPIQKFVNGNNFTYHTFFCEVLEEFIPILNEEHIGYAWVKQGSYPKPLHPGLFSTVNIDVVIDKLEILSGFSSPHQLYSVVK